LIRACTEGSLTGSDDQAYSEAKFLEVKRIIERFQGREGTAELDKRWTRKVTDVRSWFVFSASERWRSDDSEHEHYSDSGGKSGGQKEKLVGRIQEHYGLEKDEAQRQVDEWHRNLDENKKASREDYRKAG